MPLENQPSTSCSTNTTFMESKKANSMVVGVIGVFVSGVVAGFCGPVGVAILPYVIGGIVTITTGHIVTQGVQDIKTQK